MPAESPKRDLPQQKTLFDFEGRFDLKNLTGNNSPKYSLVGVGKGNTSLQINVSPGDRPGVILRPQDGDRRAWDLSHYRYVACEVMNTGKSTITVMLRADDREKAGWNNNAIGHNVIRPGERRTVFAHFWRDKKKKGFYRKYYPKMRSFPGGLSYLWHKVNPAHIVKIIVALVDHDKNKNYSYRVDNVRATVVSLQPTAKELSLNKDGAFFPFCDKYGQYMQADWPDKIKSDADLKAQLKREKTFLEQHPGVDTWNKYGGWKNGPSLKKSGHFRTQKYRGKWWLVDPEGKLFWSAGVNVGGLPSGSTPIKPSGRLKFFSHLPAKRDPVFGPFYDVSRGTIGYSFGKANLFLKYGDDFKAIYQALSHRRLRSWGFNTFGAWSDDETVSQKKTPYTRIVHPEGPFFSKKLFDPFHERWEVAVKKALLRARDSFEDPYCIGFFVNNELKWPHDHEMITYVLQKPPHQPAKKAFVSLLRKKYKSIRKLNQAWQSVYTSWRDLLESTYIPEPSRASRKDSIAFANEFAETFYRKASKVFKKVVPHKLCLGSRFHVDRRAPILAAAKYCDVVSFNNYGLSVKNVKLPPGAKDKPIMIGEYSFRGIERNQLADENRDIYDSEWRGRAFAHYAKSALENKAIVGAHWFKFAPQPITGRGDGQNDEFGLIDVADTPFYNLIKYTQDLARQMYVHRLHGKSDFDYLGRSNRQRARTR